MKDNSARVKADKNIEVNKASGNASLSLPD